jgi:ureidoglycolate lyase
MAPILTSSPTLRITPEPFTKEAFAPFGTAISCPLPRDLSSAPPLSSLPPHDPAPVIANQSSALKYSPISPLLDRYAQCPSGQPSSARMSMFSCFPRKLRTVRGTRGEARVFDVRILERHPFTTQTFTPLDLSSQTRAGDAEEPFYLVIVAPTLKGQTATATTPSGDTVAIRDPPDLNNVRAFVARGGQAVTYGAGTWHAPMVVLGSRRVDFVVVQFVNGVDDEDVQEAAFGEGMVVDLGKNRTSGASKL